MSQNWDSAYSMCIESSGHSININNQHCYYSHCHHCQNSCLHWRFYMHVIEKDWAHLDQWLPTINLYTRHGAPICPSAKAQTQPTLGRKTSVGTSTLGGETGGPCSLSPWRPGFSVAELAFFIFHFIKISHQPYEIDIIIIIVSTAQMINWDSERSNNLPNVPEGWSQNWKPGLLIVTSQERCFLLIQETSRAGLPQSGLIVWLCTQLRLIDKWAARCMLPEWI